MASGVVIPESGEISIPSFSVLGIRVHAIQIPDALRILDHWICERKSVHCVAQVGMHGSAEAIINPKLREIINSADLKNMDGTPMRWLARVHGFENIRRRVYGPELMDTLLRETGPKYKHFFYGNQASEKLSQLCAKKYGTRVAGIYPLPIWPRARNRKGKNRPCDRIGFARHCLGGAGHAQTGTMDVRIPQPVDGACIGRSRRGIDFLSGRSRQAPIWMQEHGLEWFYRLSHEPKRLWRRYLVCGPKFVWNVGLELAGIKKFD